MTDHDESGMTLVELLVAMILTLVIMTAVASSLILGLRSTQQVSDQLLDSHDAALVSVYLPSDLISAQPGGLDIGASTPTGCAGSPSEAWNVVRLTWSDAAAATTTWYRVAYRVMLNGTDWRLARFSCQAATQGALDSAPATVKLLVRNLQAPSLGLPTLVQDGEHMKLRLTDASGYSFTIAASRRLINPPGSLAPARSRPVEISDVSMIDTPSSRNGRVDKVTVTFTGQIPTNCRTAAFFDLSSVPSAGTLGSVDFGASGSSTAVLTIVEGSGAFDTSIGDFRVRFTPTTGCDALAFDGPPTRDAAPPVLVAFASGPAGDTNPIQGKAEEGDTFTLGFSEPVVGVPTAGATVTLDGGGGVNTLRIAGVSSGAQSLGSGSYVAANKSASWPSTVTAGAVTGAFIVTIGACNSTGSNVCNETTQSPGGQMTFVPASTIKDAAGNAATTLATGPVPTDPLFRAF